MPSTNLTFANQDAHRAWLVSQAALPAGFRAGTARFDFTPVEAPKPARMTLTLIALDKPTPDFAAMFTRNAFPGAPVIIGRKRLAEPALGVIIINNKISNVCAPGGVETAERICAETARHLGISPEQVLPSSTGVIGWALPADAMMAALPDAVAALSGDSILPAAEGIVTTDLYPKIRRASVGAGSIVGIAKGAGMIEPNMATMLVYILTDLAVPRDALRAMLARAVDLSFNTISIDSDTSTSDTVALVSSGKVPCAASEYAAFETALAQVCRDLAEDVVRNGEGVRHVIRVAVKGAPDRDTARALGKAIVNAPLFKCAVAGNDPNVGRLVQAIGKHVGAHMPELDVSRMSARMGGVEIFANGVFRLDPEKENALVAHLREAELYASAPTADGVFAPPVHYPPHERGVEIEIDLASGDGDCAVLGGDLTHEYVSENADYRS
ncbi:glutamate N-acetyltransferase/amino-acid N-acetyltransferase [Ereboglobus sp. PH5-10]|uniref:bifunctional glutamate N-acetyltransferase/amino-acid acetyltransferase ArgJ n=1 Tax=Ereboglobus sp. PH5-10 TaxID=2940629 RepID=UPI0024052712|nr:bifunctional glutamate N-acetyltransferase/amino-acid acetyltransferase ArgJ [Ereboglobus sp. PH5-10]MDF9827246.1 glutamate N-acetyltransferase/amino-acid N-acetyltransferase [Ereboglobus sp. PH5-10]